MAHAKVVPIKESKLRDDLQFISKTLTNKQKEVIKLLQNMEVLITNETDILITCGTETKEVTQHTLFDLANKKLIFLQTEWPFSYILTVSGERIEV